MIPEIAIIFSEKICFEILYKCRMFATIDKSDEQSRKI
jgi:hypothetical protein